MVRAPRRHPGWAAIAVQQRRCDDRSALPRRPDTEGAHPVTSEQQREIVEELLVYTIYDWIDLAFLRATVRETTRAAPDELPDKVMEVVSELIGQALVAAGDVTNAGFRAWACSRDGAIDRIDREWRAEPDPELWPFQVAALAPTQQGVAVIESVMAREGDDGSWRTRMSRLPLAEAHVADV